MIPVGLGLRALREGAVLVGVALEDGEPCVVLSTFLATTTDGERPSLDANGRRRQDRLAADGLRGVIASLAARGFDLAVAALLVNRAGWVQDLEKYAAAFAEHVPVAEGLAVREALRFACEDCGIAVVEVDEKSLALDSRVSALGANAGKPWRKEHKLATAAAWSAMTNRAL